MLFFALEKRLKVVQFNGNFYLLIYENSRCIFVHFLFCGILIFFKNANFVTFKTILRRQSGKIST